MTSLTQQKENSLLEKVLSVVHRIGSLDIEMLHQGGPATQQLADCLILLPFPDNGNN
jgi:hypothetical protein